MMLRCREASRLASKALDSPLSLRERVGLGTHLAFCAGCRTYRRQIRVLHRLLKDGMDRFFGPSVPDGFRLLPEERRALLDATVADTPERG